MSIAYPVYFQEIIDTLFPYPVIENNTGIDVEVSVRQSKSSHYEIWQGTDLLYSDLSANECALSLCNEVVRLIVLNSQNQIAFHAAALTKANRAIILPAKTGFGKTSLAAWLSVQNYEYLTDELVLFNPANNEFEAFYRPLNIKAQGLDAIQPLQSYFHGNTQLKTQSVTLISAFNENNQPQLHKCLKAGLFIFPNYTADSDLLIESLTPAQSGLELMACNVNARNIKSHGFNDVADIARTVPAIRLTYSKFEQLEGMLPKLIDLILSSALDVKLLRALTCSGKSKQQPFVNKENIRSVPRATKKGSHKKLCIGMATYDDYDGVYFTVQALSLYHSQIIDDIEILVVDNHPTGQCAHELKALDGRIKNLRYIPVLEQTGTGVRDVIFKQANSEYVLCLDCHVFIEPAGVRRLMDYFSANPKTNDLLQGPMYSDDLNSLYTHFDPVWRNGMYGVWAQDQRGLLLKAPAFDIPMQGLGLFACRKESWPGLNKHFRGFGGEEGYIHEKYRKNGHRTLCLPFLRWLHRFARPMGVPYPVNWADRIRNYLIGYSELGLDINPVIEHFNAHVGESLTSDVLNSYKKEFSKGIPSQIKVN